MHKNLFKTAIRIEGNTVYYEVLHLPERGKKYFFSWILKAV